MKLESPEKKTFTLHLALTSNTHQFHFCFASVRHTPLKADVDMAINKTLVAMKPETSSRWIFTLKSIQRNPTQFSQFRLVIRCLSARLQCSTHFDAEFEAIWLLCLVVFINNNRSDNFSATTIFNTKTARTETESSCVQHTFLPKCHFQPNEKMCVKRLGK